MASRLSLSLALTLILLPASQAGAQATDGGAAAGLLAHPAAHAVPEGTGVRLMLLREITSRTAKPGDRFKLRVDEAVVIDGRTLIPVGATAWGEITTVEKNGAAGKGGSLVARLLFIQLDGGNVPLSGDLRNKSSGNGTAVGLAVLGFGLLGLLNAGDSGRLKAGDTFTAYTASPAERSGEILDVQSRPIVVKE